MTIVDQIKEYLALDIMLIGLINLIVLPYLIISKLQMLQRRIDYLQSSVDDIEEIITREDDPDPADENDERELSNVVAIGKKRVA